MSLAGQLGLLFLYFLTVCAMIRLQAYSMRAVGRTSLRRTHRWTLPAAGTRANVLGTARNYWSAQPVAYHSMSSGRNSAYQYTSYKLCSSLRDTPPDTEINTITRPSITLTTEESDLFDMILQFVNESKLNTTVRVAGGWVRDKVLQLPSKFDIDLALEKVTGVQFAQLMQEWMVTSKRDHTMAFGVIVQNVEKSKHLETVCAKFGDLEVDIVNLRTEAYTQNSRVPQIQIGTPLEDALRRDLTINALYYNLHTRQVEDFTSRGLQDLQAGIVRTPLPALVTLKDDPLRAFRVVRFACRFGFRVVSEAAQACRNSEVHVSLATKVSRERSSEELQLMFRSPAAARAVTLLYSYGLLQCLLRIPDALYVPQSKSQPFDSKAESVAVSLPVAAAVQRDFLRIGTATVLVEHYMRQSLNAKAMGEKFPLWASMLDNLDCTSDLWRLFTLSSLLTATDGYVHKEAFNNGSMRDKAVALTDLLLTKQLLMSKKDIAMITRTLHSSNAFHELLQTATTTATVIDRATTSPGAVAGIPSAVGPLSRLQVGLAIRQAGEHYQYALYLAAAQEVVHRMRKTHSSNSDGLKEESKVYEEIIRDLQSLGNIQTSTVEDGQENVFSRSSAPPAATSTIATQRCSEYEREMSAVCVAVEVVLRAIDTMSLHDALAVTAPYAGHALLEAFPRAPKGPILSEMKECQIVWKLNNPNGSDVELMCYMKTKYADHV